MATTTSGTISNWYTQQYSGAFRANRLRAPTLVPSRRVGDAAAIQQTLVVDVARQLGIQLEGQEEKQRRRETIFGPDVGEDDEPGWTKPEQGTKVSVDVVKAWVEKAKSEEGLHATTTLQALVNLKRPTLLLQQLDLGNDPSRTSLDREGEITPARRDSVNPAPPLHSLKFNYDATSPQVNVTILVYPSPLPVPEGKESFVHDEEPTTIYSGVHPGGFNQLFTLPSTHALDLSSAIAPHGDGELHNVDLDDGTKKEGQLSPATGRDSESIDTTRTSLDRSMNRLHVGSTQPDLATVPELGNANGNNQQQGQTGRSRMFGLFPRRNQERDLEAGNIEMTNRPSVEEKADDAAEKEIEKGMRLLIKIDALGAEGEALKRRNAQLTHILITGMWVAEPNASTTDAATAPPPSSGKRVWVVKVVRREAVIGAHTFLLKEIYGLSSAAKDTAPQPASYPPTAGATADDPYASTPNECIVCLTSPRDVVLLPCRHLVVCRDCAVGMIEFGAGGKVGRRDGDNAPAATGTEGEAAAAGGPTPPAAPAAPAPPVAGGTTATGRERRKKKPKGWYCPVCRQPYTSLLRLALPTSEMSTPPLERAPSIRSTRSRRAPSIAPTLPDGAEEMLESLRPKQSETDEGDVTSDLEDAEGHSHDHDHAHGHAHVHDLEAQRPQFVLGEEIDESHTPTGALPEWQVATSENGQSKGWKQV